MNQNSVEQAIRTFNEERNEEHLLNLLFTLKDSFVWIPCNMVMSEADQARLQAMLEEKDPEGLIGTEFTAHDEARLVPDLLTNGEKLFFPVFSREEAMGEYGEHFSKIERSFPEAITLAMNNDKKPEGMVVNAFSESFVLTEELCKVILNMVS